MQPQSLYTTVLRLIPSCIPAGTVTVYNVSATATPFQLAEQFAMYGDVKDVREDPQVQGCWLVEYYDIRHAAAAFKGLSRSSSSHATLPVVSETDASQAPQQSLRNVQSSHVLNNEYGSSNQLADESWQGSRSWDNKTGAAFQEHLQTLLQQQQNGGLLQMLVMPLLRLVKLALLCNACIFVQKDARFVYDYSIMQWSVFMFPTCLMLCNLRCNAPTKITTTWHLGTSGPG